MTLEDRIGALITRLQPDADAELVGSNLPGGLTYRLSTTEGTRYLKVGAEDLPATHDLTAEADRLRWIGDRFPVPRVLDAGRSDGLTWLLSAELPGVPASDPRWGADPRRTARLLGQGTRAFHDALDAASCPWSWRITDRDAVGSRSGKAVALLETAPAELDLVVCHGDLCAPNMLLSEDGASVGVVDVGKLGVADRAADLGCQVWSLEFNGMADQVEEFLDAYGFVGDPDHISWYHDYYMVV